MDLSIEDTGLKLTLDGTEYSLYSGTNGEEEAVLVLVGYTFTASAEAVEAFNRAASVPKQAEPSAAEPKQAEPSAAEPKQAELPGTTQPPAPTPQRRPHR